MRTSHPFRPGSAYVLAMIMLSMLAMIAIAFASVTDLSLRKSDNCRVGANARMSAESGLAFMLNTLGEIRLSGTTTTATLGPNLRAALAGRLNGTGNVAGQSVGLTGSTVQVPLIAVETGSFNANLVAVNDTRCRMTVAATSDLARSGVTLEFNLVSRRAGVFDYGVASRGPITVSGHARILGVNNLAEASLLSSTSSQTNAISINGSVRVDGDLSTASPDSQITITGSPTIAGSSDPNVIAQHVHLGVEPPDWPVMDPVPLAALATNVVTATTNLHVVSLNNIRIKAGTNPTFINDIILNGVIYVESPNVVRFEGHSDINGLIVTQDAGKPLEQCQLFFAGGVDARGVDALPNTPEFAAVKKQTGTFILAPGFGVTFAGNFSAINGTIAADQLTFAGTAEGVVKGSVLGLKDLPTTVSGNVDISVDRAHADPNPAGFVKMMAIVPDSNSYAETMGGP